MFMMRSLHIHPAAGCESAFKYTVSSGKATRVVGFGTVLLIEQGSIRASEWRDEWAWWCKVDSLLFFSGERC